MTEMQIFENTQFGNIRAVEIDGEPWLVGKDVAAALGYERTAKAIQDHVDEDDKVLVDGKTQSQFGIELGQRGGCLINESGMYSLVLSSKLPSAKQFRRWVTSEVLPSIRKHGAYVKPDTLDKMIASPEFGIKLLTALQHEREARQALETEMERAKPKVVFADAVAASDKSILVGEMAKLLKQNGVDTGQNRFFGWLRENGYLIRRHGTDFNMPTQMSLEMGLFEIKEKFAVHSDGHTSISKTPKVTGKGQQYFVNEFLGG